MNFGKGYWKTFREGLQREWVITNGLGGYAGSSIIGANTRKHHGLLIASLHPPVNRYLVLSKLNENITLNGKSYSFNATQRPTINEEGHLHLQRFTYDVIPTFDYQIEDFFLTKQIALEYGKNTVGIAYDIQNGSSEAILDITPLFNYRDHNQRVERAELNFQHKVNGSSIELIPDADKSVTITLNSSMGNIVSRSNIYDEDMEYQTEIDTGMSAIDNHFTPYNITIKLAPFEKAQISITCSTETSSTTDAFKIVKDAKTRGNQLVKNAGYTDDFANNLVLAADQFIAYRKSTGLKTVLAGLPWFADWGRDTMIALQGLTLVTKRFDETKDILLTFAKYVRNGLVPNMFPDEGNDPFYNTVDASMWYFFSIDQYLRYTDTEEAYSFIEKEIYPKLEEIIAAYKNGTDFSIKMDEDGLISAGGGLDQVTWMDVRVGEWVVTPRHGKPVEINALWYNALKVMENLANKFGKESNEYSSLAETVKTSFNTHFWNEEKNCLFDVVSSDGSGDSKIRPNQIWAVSLPYTMLDEDKNKKIVQTVLSHLYASNGLRTLSPFDPEYKGLYKGQLHDRDAAYHQGTTWAFPLGGLITAYVKVNNHSKESLLFAKKLLAPLEDHLRDGCIGSIAEVFDGNEPIISRGCYAQAWSVGEILRCYVEDVLIPLEHFNSK
ncbi:MAG: hypothetical protein K0R15_1907 [Clostridiales bacterium]|jgi:predicted glycogen debranching enzyme|nr:hypothetical protein [Clostridiales bacterium]